MRQDQAKTFSIGVDATTLTCPTGERYADQQIREGSVPVLRCQARQMRQMLRDGQLVEIDALSLYKKYTDVFEIDDVPESEREAVARDVANRILAELGPIVGGTGLGHI